MIQINNYERDFTVSNNTIDGMNTTNVSIYVFSDSGDIYNGNVTDNTISNIYIDGIQYHATNATTPPTQIYDQWLLRNTLTRVGLKPLNGDGVYVYGNGGNLSRFHIRDNNITNTDGDCICIRDKERFLTYRNSE